MSEPPRISSTLHGNGEQSGVISHVIFENVNIGGQVLQDNMLSNNTPFFIAYGLATDTQIIGEQPIFSHGFE